MPSMMSATAAGLPRTLALTTLWCVGMCWGGPAVATPTSPASSLPLAERLRPELAAAPAATLLAFERALVGRLYLDDGRLALRAARDLHDVVTLVAVADALAERAGASSPATSSSAEEMSTEALMARARATWIVHAAGVGWDESAPWRASVEGLPETAEGAADRELFQALRDSVAGLRNVGRVRFPNALHAALGAGVDTPELHHLRGLWLEREERFSEALVAIRRVVDARATVASTLDLVRVAAKAGHLQEATALGEGLATRAPAARGAIDALLREQQARVATTDFEKLEPTADVDVLAAQALRYDLLGQRGAATRLLSRLIGGAPGHEATVQAVGTLGLRWRRPERIATFLKSARAEGRWSLSHTSLRIAAVLMARLAAARGEEVHALADADIADDLRRLRLRGGLRGRIAARQAAIVLAGTEEQPQTSAISSAVDAATPLDAETARVAAAVWLMVGRPLEAMSVLDGSLQDHEDGSSLRIELAALELAYGAHRADRGMVRKGLARVVADPTSAPVARYLRAVGERLNAWMGDRTARGSDAAALAELAPLVDQLDPTQSQGLVAGRAAALSVAALAMATGDAPMASGALRIAGRFPAGGSLGWLAAGQLALAGDDISGAAALLDEATARAAPGRERWLTHKWRALVANRGAEPAVAASHLQEMLTSWPRADVGDIKRSRRPLGLLTGGVEIGVELDPKRGPHLDVALTVLPVLAPDFPHDRRQLERVLARGTKAK